MAYTNAISAYRETRIKTASQGQLIIMLYDEAIKCLDKALDLISSNAQGKKDPSKIEHINSSILKAQEIITELSVSLDFDQGGEIAQNLFAIYTWFHHELLEGNITQDFNRIKIIRDMVNDLRNAWHVIASEKAPEAAEKKAAVGINIAG